MSKLLKNPAANLALFAALGGSYGAKPIFKAEAGDPSGQLAELKSALMDIKAQLKEASNDRLNSDEAKKRLDELLHAHNTLKASFDATQQLIAQLNERGAESGRIQTAGQIITASAEYAAISAKGAKFSGTVGFDVQNALTSVVTGGNAVAADRLPGIVSPQMRLTVRGLLSPGSTASNAVEFMRETGFTNNAAPVSENPGTDKPESTITLAKISAPVATIAHWLVASKQILSDAPMMTSYIDTRLRYGLAIAVEEQLLKGDGTGVEVDGLINQASAFANPGVSVVNETRLDRLRIAMLQVALSDYDADGIVLNPIDWATIELSKGTDDKYLFSSPQGSASPSLWGLPVVATKSIDLGDYLVGAFRMGAQVFDRETATVQISTENKDNFVRNMVTILAEERLALAVYRPEAFVTGNFGSL